MADDEFDEFDDFDDAILLAAVEQIEDKKNVSNEAKHQSITKPQVAKQKTMADFGFAKKVEPTSAVEVEGRASNPVRQSAIKSHHKVDQKALQTWIYPINFPLREYQFNIAQSSLFSNTLVCLPTGYTLSLFRLGKTFIAAVVMYNYFRWFPEGKIVFMAPTKPLVNQQIDACYKITGIDSKFCCEMTGNVKSEIRSKHWASKRIFFMTPETFRNDLQNGTCDSQKVVLVVFDEAHRASGKYAYCDIVKELERDRAVFRVMALSATPGSEAKKVQAVIQNLLVEKLQMRTEESMDVQKNIFKRTVEEVLIKPTPFLQEIIDIFIKFPEKILQRLVQNKVYREANPMRATVYGLIVAGNNFRQNKNSFAKGKHGMIGGDLYIAQQLLRALETLTGCGLRAFYQEMFALSQEVKQNTTSSVTKREIVNSLEFKKMMEKLEMDMKRPDFSSHPKMDKLSQLVVDHFKNHTGEGDTRIMVFSTLRSTVEEIVTLLNSHSPLVRPALFVGQAKGTKNSAGMKQKDQLRVISEFHAGVHNVIVATCIGEEGLDIGELDLIICFDNQKSPIRMLQRCGRTGRKRQGKICLLINQGKEEEAVKSARRSYKNVQNSIIDGKRLEMYGGELAGVIPGECTPVCSKMELVISQPVEKIVKMKKAALVGKAYLDEQQEKDYIRRYMSEDVPFEKFQLNNQLLWQTAELPLLDMPRSEKSSVFVSLMEYFEEIKATEAPAQISEQFLKSSQSQKVLPSKNGVKKRTIATIRPSTSLSSELDIPSQFQKDNEVDIVNRSQDLSAIDIDADTQPIIKSNMDCQSQKYHRISAGNNAIDHLEEVSDFESIDFPNVPTFTEKEANAYDPQRKEISTDAFDNPIEKVSTAVFNNPNETVEYSDFEFDETALEQIENQFLKPTYVLERKDVESLNVVEKANQVVHEQLATPITPFVRASIKRPKLDVNQRSFGIASTPNVDSPVDTLIARGGPRKNVILSSNSHASPAVQVENDPISSSEEEPEPTGLRKILLEKRKRVPRAAPKDREFKVPVNLKTTRTSKPKQKRRKNIKAYEMGLLDVEVEVTSDTGTSEEFTGSEYDSDLSGFIAHTQVPDTPGFYRKDLAVRGRSDASKFLLKPTNPMPFRRVANPPTEESQGSLADFVNDEIIYSDKSGILPEDQNTQDFEDSLERSVNHSDLPVKSSPSSRKAIEDMDAEDMFDF